MKTFLIIIILAAFILLTLRAKKEIDVLIAATSATAQAMAETIKAAAKLEERISVLEQAERAEEVEQTENLEKMFDAGFSSIMNYSVREAVKGADKNE